MLKTVPTDELTPGMFIHDLNCSWLKHPFVRSQFLIRRTGDIERIRELGIQSVVIDTEQAETIPDDAERIEAQQQETARLQAELDAFSDNRPARERHRHTHLEQEMVAARAIQKEANGVVESVMHDARLGRQIELAQLKPINSRLIDSVIRNQNALLSLNRIRSVDRYTFEHSIAVAVLLVTYAHAQGMQPEIIHQLGMGGLLHDIGKTRVPEEILTKPGKLTPEEFAVIQGHVNHGIDIIQELPDIPQATFDVVAQHHERHDGTGYPNGLKGEAISLYGQMAAVVDVYDAITADRCYHRGEHPTLVLRKLLEWSRSHFREEVVHHFIQCVGIYPAGTLVRMESGRLAVVLDPGEKILYPKVKVFYNTNTDSLIPPVVIDLANPGYHDDHIAGYEDPNKWDFPIDRLLE